MKKYYWLIALVAIFALAFAGFVSCKGDGDEDGDNNGKKPGDNPTPPPAPVQCINCHETPCAFDNIWECMADSHDFVPGSGGSGGKFGHNDSNKFLFKDGNFASQIGNTYLFSFTDNNGLPTGRGPLTLLDSTAAAALDPTWENSLMTIGGGGMVGIFFEKYIDVTDAKNIILSIHNGDANWSGGILFFHNDASPETPLQSQFWGGGGHMSDPSRGGAKVFNFGLGAWTTLSESTAAPDFSKLVGFALKSTGHLVVHTIEILDPPPLYTPLDSSGFTVHKLTTNNPYPLSGQSQIGRGGANDLTLINGAKAGSKVVVYFYSLGTDGSQGRFGPSSSLSHSGSCTCSSISATGGQGGDTVAYRYDWPSSGTPENHNSLISTNFLKHPSENEYHLEVPIDVMKKLSACIGDGANTAVIEGRINVNAYSGGVVAGIELWIPN